MIFSCCWSLAPHLNLNRNIRSDSLLAFNWGCQAGLICPRWPSVLERWPSLVRPCAGLLQEMVGCQCDRCALRPLCGAMILAAFACLSCCLCPLYLTVNFPATCANYHFFPLCTYMVTTHWIDMISDIYIYVYIYMYSLQHPTAFAHQ